MRVHPNTVIYNIAFANAIISQMCSKMIKLKVKNNNKKFCYVNCIKGKGINSC